MLLLIRIAAGDTDLIAEQSGKCGIEEEGLKEAAEFCLQQMFLKAGNSRHRLLGLSADAGIADLRNHRRWLLKWLHPDRSGSTWKTAYFNHISEAAKSLEAEMAAGVNAPAKPQPVANLTPPKAARPPLSRRQIELLEATPLQEPGKARKFLIVVLAAAALAASAAVVFYGDVVEAITRLAALLAQAMTGART